MKLRRPPLRGLAALCAAAALASCNMPPTFGPEYYDAGRNFIAARSLAAPTPTADSAGGTDPDPSAVWDWSWRGQTGTLNEHPYMVLAAADPGPDGAEPAWRLELANLAANPSFALNLAPWVVSATESSVASVGGADPAAIHGNSMRITIGDSRFGQVSADANLFADGAWAPATKNYLLAFNVSEGGALRAASGDSYAPESLQNLAWPSAGRVYVPADLGIGYDSAGSRRFYLSRQPAGDSSIDDIHAIRSDLDASLWSLSLRLRQEDTTPRLVPGLYAFSVWVKRPVGYSYPDDPTRGDSTLYAAKYLTLRLVNLVRNTTVAEAIFDVSAYADWTRVALFVPFTSPLDFTEGADGQILRLDISPMNRLRPEAGAVLISRPELRYYVDGF